MRIGVPAMKYLLIVPLIAMTTGLAETPDTSAALRPGVHAVRLREPITIDGDLSEPVWQNEFGFSTFRQRDPVENGQPTQRTIIRVAYDDAAVYIGARMTDTAPDSIIANLGRRDVSVSSDRFNVFVDAYHDKRTGFYF